MKNMKYTFGALLLLISLCSCSNLFNKDVTKTKDSNTYVMLTSDSVSVRSISPTQEYALEKLKSITFYAKMDGKSKRTLASSVASLSVLYNYQFVLPDGAGSYTFELQGTLDSVNYYAKLTDIEIKEGETNPISFELKPVKSSSDYSEFEDFGGISCTLNFNKTNVNKIHYKLENLSSSNIVDQGDITSFSNVSNSSYNSKATYKHLANNTTGSTARLPVGQYRLTFDFLTEDTSLNDFVVINSFPYIVNVEKGRNSYLEENFDLSQVYTITYKANGGSLDLGSRMQTKFASKHEVMLPRMQKDGFTFQGWYTTSTFETGTGPIEKVEQGTTENKIFYAKFANSAIYVDPTTTNTINDGSEENPVTTLSAAIAKIKAIETTDQSDWLQWYIKVKGTITESLVIALNEDQMALPLKAKGVTFVGASDLKNGEPQDVIQGDGTKPVFTIATSTQVSFKNIKITGGKDSEGYDGAGIVMKDRSIVTIEDGTLITGNTASTNGGGIAVFDNANLMLAGGKITGNTCGTDKHGKDIYCSDSGHISVCGNPVIDDLYMPNSVTLLDNMTAGASITITPADYVIPHYEDSEGGYIYKAQVIHVVEGSGISISDNSKYFHITPESDDDTKEWSIDSEGCLNLPCTVSFANLGDGGALEPITVLCKELESGDLPDPEEREGYIFTGWYYKKADWQNNYKMKPVEVKEGYYDEDGYFYKTNVPTAIVEDMTLYAGWMTTSNNIYIDAADGIDYASIESSGEDTSIKFGSGTEEEPLQNIKEALNVIRKINDNQEDYTLTIRHSSGEYNIYIDDTIPAKSLTIQGSEEGTTEDPDGFSSSSYHDDYSYQIRVSTQIPVTFQNLTITNKLWGYTTDGPVINITNGANVTLGNKAVIKGANSIYGGGKAPLGAIAVEDDSTLTMLEGSLIDTFYIRNGAVYVKEGGKFIMEGGTITHINSHNTGGAVYVEGGTKVISGANFEMKGGSITGNETASVYNTNITTNLHGAGVCVVSGSFEMSGGEITNNTAHVSEVDWSTAAGGGVFVYADASFAMSDGEISGNKAVKTYVNNSNETVEGPNASAYGGGVCLQASGSKIASFTMTGGTISGNTAGTSGNGIGFLGSLDDGVTGTISLGGDAIITDNDIYLPSNVTITIVEPMTSGLTPSIRATITPQEYTANQPILNDNGESLENEYDYFAVTPQSDGTITTHWFIDENGKLYKYSVGDLLLTDGTFVYYDESHTFSEDEVSAAVGLVYGLDEEGKPRGILGLKNSSGASPYIATPWAPQSSSGSSIKFEEIICTPSGTGGNITFGGDTDGSDNWEYICEQDPEGSEAPATNYPAFYYALNYAETAGLTHSAYNSGWYMPSAAEMYDIYKNLTTINSVLTKIKAVTSDSANILTGLYFWTSSQADAVEVGNSAWYINITATSNPFTSSNKEWDSPSVCCIRKYEKQ